MKRSADVVAGIGQGGVMICRATALDVAAVVDLRAAVFASMGFDGDPQGPRGEPAPRWFTAHLAVDACVYLAYEGEELVAMALGYLQIAPPSPSSTAGVRGYVSDVMTLEAHRRRGHARRCVEALSDWFREETPVALVGSSAMWTPSSCTSPWGGSGASSRPCACAWSARGADAVGTARWASVFRCAAAGLGSQRRAMSAVRVAASFGR